MTCRISGRTIPGRGETAVPADNYNMKRVIAIAAALVVACSSVAAAQVAGQTLADVAKKEEARRKTVKKATKVYTNESLKPDISVGLPPSAPAGTTASSNTTPANTTPGGQAPAANPAQMKDQAYWAGRMSKARTDMGRTQMFADSLQTKINSLRTDFVNRDNRVEREKIQQELNTALAELERLKKEIEEQRKAITAIEDEARRAGVPSGWLRPSV